MVCRNKTMIMMKWFCNLTCLCILAVQSVSIKELSIIEASKNFIHLSACLVVVVTMQLAITNIPIRRLITLRQESGLMGQVFISAGHCVILAAVCSFQNTNMPRSVV